jgi:hypothetical protein
MTRKRLRSTSEVSFREAGATGCLIEELDRTVSSSNSWLAPADAALGATVCLQRPATSTMRCRQRHRRPLVVTGVLSRR